MVGSGTHRYLKLGHSQIQLRTPAMDTTHKSTAAQEHRGAGQE